MVILEEPYSRENWDKLFELCKTYYIVRWNINELIQGYKMVGNPGYQIKIYLNNALKDKI